MPINRAVKVKVKDHPAVFHSFHVLPEPLQSSRRHHFRMTRETVKAFVVICGKTLNSHQAFLDHLSRSPNFHKVTSVEDSNVIIAFAPVVSRAGTDIEAALRKIKAISATQPVVLVVLHHTTEKDPVVPNSSRSVDRSDVFTVDCPFNEDRGLLSCQHNDEALKAVKEHLGLEDGRTHRQWAWQLLFWTLALLTTILISCLSTPDYIHAIWFIPWMLLLLVILLERRGYGKWNPLIIVIVNMVVILLSLLTSQVSKKRENNSTALLADELI
ncbi:uncharacterized protein LOC119262436 isoform X2 [Pygocentrus nattereri]|uniref:uncharacterized protein LOC119262436 isoform X2 n=1 Tax=Pygocentrus nattereri TaxID=42514 RepID=UPI001890C1F3|nr:uncharacterized protein LOC119262436 isoform X2 [Pygocentrus nattereri]